MGVRIDKRLVWCWNVSFYAETNGARSGRDSASGLKMFPGETGRDSSSSQNRRKNTPLFCVWFSLYASRPWHFSSGISFVLLHIGLLGVDVHEALPKWEVEYSKKNWCTPPLLQHTSYYNIWKWEVRTFSYCLMDLILTRSRRYTHLAPTKSRLLGPPKVRLDDVDRVNVLQEPRKTRNITARENTGIIFRRFWVKEPRRSGTKYVVDEKCYLFYRRARVLGGFFPFFFCDQGSSRR